MLISRRRTALVRRGRGPRAHAQRARQRRQCPLAFLGSEPLGDDIALPVADGRPLIVHDARTSSTAIAIDLLAVRVEPGTPVRPAVRA